MSIEDVREFLREAERLEFEATDCRVQAQAIVDTHGLCADVISSAPTRRGSSCCGNPDNCTGRVWA